MSSAGSTLKLLRGVRVVDLSVSLASAFCTSLLQRYGADVMRVKPTQWGSEQKTPFYDEYLAHSPVYDEYVHSGKEVLELDLSAEEGRSALTEQFGSADVVVEDWRRELLEEAGLEPASLRRDFPNMIVVSLSPFGRTGPRRDWPASDLTLYHGGGPGFATPGLVVDPEDTPPIRQGSHQGCFVSGLTAATNVCAALLLRKRAPSSAGMQVDFSCHEAMANTFRQSLGTFAYYGGGLNRDLARGRGAGGTADTRNIRCADGWINMSWVGVKQWETLRDLMGDPEWMKDERLENPGLRHRNWAVVFPHLEEWASQYDKDSLFYLVQANRIPCAPVNDGADLLASDAFSSRSYWDERDRDGKATKFPSIHSQFSRTQR